MFDTKTSSNAAADAADIHRNAYNAAFYELGLKWYWDGRIYPSVLGRDDERDCLRTYLLTHQPHLLKAYDAEFLIDAIQTTKARCYETMTAEGCGAGAHVNWAEMQQNEVGV